MLILSLTDDALKSQIYILKHVNIREEFFLNILCLSYYQS